MTTWPNHALQRTRRGRLGCKRCVSCAGSLSFVVRRHYPMSFSIPPDIAEKMTIATQPMRLLPNPIPDLLSGSAAFVALKQAVEELTRSAPEDCDVVIRAFDLFVSEVRFIKPHTLLFRGLTDDGHDATVVCHFSQLVARVIYRPRRGATRVVTGFSNEAV